MDWYSWASGQVDDHFVNPLADRLAHSVANPYFASYLLWNRLKQMTPQRARDLARVLSTALTDSIEVLGGEQGQRLAATSRRFGDDFTAAVVSEHGREVVLNSVASASHVAQAVATPEAKRAVNQLSVTLQSVIDFLASDPGRQTIATGSDFITQLLDTAASPEAAVLLTEVASNILHAMESESLRQPHGKSRSHSTSSSSGETYVETESETPTPQQFMYKKDGFQEKRAHRSARIEKEVLLRLGVQPSMLSDIQNVMDEIEAEEDARERKAMEEQAAADALRVSDDAAFAKDDANIAAAFGVEATELPLSNKDEREEHQEVLLPEWHRDAVRHALRQRKSVRPQPQDNIRQVMDVLKQHQVASTGVSTSDAAVCRVLSLFLVYSFGACLLLSFLLFTRYLYTYI